MIDTNAALAAADPKSQHSESGTAVASLPAGATQIGWLSDVEPWIRQRWTLSSVFAYPEALTLAFEGIFQTELRRYLEAVVALQTAASMEQELFFHPKPHFRHTLDVTLEYRGRGRPHFFLDDTVDK